MKIAFITRRHSFGEWATVQYRGHHTRETGGARVMEESNKESPPECGGNGLGLVRRDARSSLHRAPFEGDQLIVGRKAKPYS